MNDYRKNINITPVIDRWLCDLVLAANNLPQIHILWKKLKTPKETNPRFVAIGHRPTAVAGSWRRPSKIRLHSYANLIKHGQCEPTRPSIDKWRIDSLNPTFPQKPWGMPAQTPSVDRVRKKNWQSSTMMWLKTYRKGRRGSNLFVDSPNLLDGDGPRSEIGKR